MTDVQKLRALLDAAQVPGPVEFEAGHLELPDGGEIRAMLVTSGDMLLAACGDPEHPGSRPDAALIAAAVNALPELLDEVERLRVSASAAERRAEESEAERTRHMLLATVADLKAQKSNAQAAAGRVAIRMLMDDHDPSRYSRCQDRECDHVRLGLSALGDDAGRTLLDRLHAAEAERDELRAEVGRLKARRAEMCECVNCNEPVANYTDDRCPKCGGSGGVVVEGDK